jgi:hypothetical protein
MRTQKKLGTRRTTAIVEGIARGSNFTSRTGGYTVCAVVRIPLRRGQATALTVYGSAIDPSCSDRAEQPLALFAYQSFVDAYEFAQQFVVRIAGEFGARAAYVGLQSLDRTNVGQRLAGSSTYASSGIHGRSSEIGMARRSWRQPSAAGSGLPSASWASVPIASSLASMPGQFAVCRALANPKNSESCLGNFLETGFRHWIAGWSGREPHCQPNRCAVRRVRRAR